MAQMLLKTPLHDRHIALGARMVPFAGWEMPVQYEGVIVEHLAVRADCGVFDVSHMGELEVEGPRATASSRSRGRVRSSGSGCPRLGSSRSLKERSTGSSAW